MKRARLLVMLGGAIGCADPSAPVPPLNSCAGVDGPCAIVTFVWDSRPDTMRVLVTHAPTIAAAQDRVATGVGPTIPAGPIVRGTGSDPALPFHYVADSLRLADAAMEICDGRMMRTVEQLNEYFQGITGRADASRAMFCPWGARPIDVQLPASAAR